MDHTKSPKNDGINVILQIDDSQKSATIFEPQSSIDTRNSSNSYAVSAKSEVSVTAPEKKLTLFALRLAILEKAATGLGTLGFIWATVVLLGGFAITLDQSDFWLITIILLIEGTRIFSRSHELEWQHQATWSIADVGINSFRILRSSSHFLIKSLKKIISPLHFFMIRSQRSREIAINNLRESSHQNRIRPSQIARTWTTMDVPILPYAPWVFLLRNISKLLYWLQLLSATACVVLSLLKLIKHNYGEVAKGDMDKRNRKAALTVFYALALSEALLFLIEKAYWEWKVIYCKLLESVNKECDLGNSGLISIRRFFYDAYSRCVNGSMFDGLKMDMVSFGMDLLNSSSLDEQVIGARILRKFATNEKFSDDTLQKIGINLSVIERLVEMLNWKDSREEEIRLSAAEILSRLAGKKQNSLRVAGIFGAMESISSLLHTYRGSTNAASDEIYEKKTVFNHEKYEFWTFNHLGLGILKKLARDHDNCGKIGNTRGLLPKIIEFTHASERLLNDANATPSQILTVKRSLQVVKMLVSTAGSTGKHLRKEISEIIFTISNIRDILRHGEKHPELQKLGIEILTNLALEEDATERIGGTGGVLKELLIIFFKNGAAEDLNRVRIAAGEALAMLVLESKSNCHRVLRLEAMMKLVGALEDRLVRVNAARILRNLCSYSGTECLSLLKGVTAAAPTVLKAISSEESKLQEVMVGLASHVFKFMPTQESTIVFEIAQIKESELANTLVEILKKYRYPPIKTPRIRRFVIEMAIWMMKNKKQNVEIFKDLGMEKELVGVLETTSELENFNIFSGTVGISRHRITIHALIESALDLLSKI